MKLKGEREREERRQGVIGTWEWWNNRAGIVRGAHIYSCHITDSLEVTRRHVSIAEWSSIWRRVCGARTQRRLSELRWLWRGGGEYACAFDDPLKSDSLN